MGQKYVAFHRPLRKAEAIRVSVEFDTIAKCFGAGDQRCLSRAEPAIEARGVLQMSLPSPGMSNGPNRVRVVPQRCCVRDVGPTGAAWRDRQMSVTTPPCRPTWRRDDPCTGRHVSVHLLERPVDHQMHVLHEPVGQRLHDGRTNGRLRGSSWKCLSSRSRPTGSRSTALQLEVDGPAGTAEHSERRAVYRPSRSAEIGQRRVRLGHDHPD